MADRFEKIYQLPNSIFFENSPVIISAGVMLRDTESGSIIVQMKFHSVSLRIINAVKVSLNIFDISGESLPSVSNYQYLDLYIGHGTDFGDNKAIMVESPIARSFSLEKITVVFSDGEFWTNETPMIVLPLAEPIAKGLLDHELITQYQMDTTMKSKNIPIRCNDLWRCACGEWNSGKNCSGCGCSFAHIFKSFDVDSLKREIQCRLEEKRKKQKKAIAVVWKTILIIISVLGLLNGTLYKQQSPEETMQQASEMQYVSACVERITDAIKIAMAGTVTLKGEDREHYSYSFSIRNASNITFSNFEIITIWGTETISVKKELWMPDETWEIKLIIPQKAAQGDALSIDLKTSYEAYDVQKS